MVRISSIAAVAAPARLCSATALAGTIPAGFYAGITLPGNAQVTIGALTVLLEGATEFSSPLGGPQALTGGQLTELETIAPGLGPAAYQLQWSDPHDSAAGAGGQHRPMQVLNPIVSTTPNFDTVVKLIDPLTFTAAGQVQETQVQIVMLDLQSVNAVDLGGFHYELLAELANGSPVCDNPCSQFTGNLKFDSTFVDPTTGGVSGTLDLGVTGPTPTAANLGADLPAGMEGLPVNFEIQFIPLDGGPPIPNAPGEIIFQNTGPSSFSPVPEPGTVALLATGLLGLATSARGRKPRP
jgi:hypothetical protein